MKYPYGSYGFTSFLKKWFLGVHWNLICYLKAFLNVIEEGFAEQNFDWKITEGD